MNKHFITSLAAALTAFGAQAANVVDTYDEGKPSLGEDGIILLLYPDGWNAKMTNFAKNFLDSPELQKNAGNAVVIGVPMPNASSEEEKDERKKKLGPINLPSSMGTISFPVFYLYEASGRQYATINGFEYLGKDFFRGKGAEKIAGEQAGKLISERLAGLRQQRELMAMAEKATGKDKAELLARAARVDKISRPDKVVDMIKQADPNDEGGNAQALSINIMAVIEKAAKSSDWKASLAEVEDYLKNPALTTEQKQMLHTCAIGILRRSGEASQHKKMIEYAQALRDLDPESRYGKSYVGVMRLWGNKVIIENAWTPQSLPKTDGIVEITGDLSVIKEPGMYKVSFNYKSGKHALQLSRVALFDGDKEIAADEHNSFSGSRHTNHVFNLKVPATVKEPHLFITTSMKGKIDSTGNVEIEK